MLISFGINVNDEWMTSWLNWLPCYPRALNAMRMRHTLSLVCKSNWMWIVTGICECVVFMETWMYTQCPVQQLGGPWIRARVLSWTVAQLNSCKNTTMSGSIVSFHCNEWSWGIREFLFFLFSFFFIFRYLKLKLLYFIFYMEATCSASYFCSCLASPLNLKLSLQSDGWVLLYSSWLAGTKGDMRLSMI